MNDACVDGIAEQCSAFVNASSPHYLQTVFEEKLSAFEDLSQEEREACLEAHTRLMDSCVLPAYEQLSEGLLALRGSGTTPAGSPALNTEPTTICICCEARWARTHPRRRSSSVFTGS